MIKVQNENYYKCFMSAMDPAQIGIDEMEGAREAASSFAPRRRSAASSRVGNHTLSRRWLLTVAQEDDTEDMFTLVAAKIPENRCGRTNHSFKP